jgi:hypothetical protein
LSAWVSTVTESAVADATVPRTRSGIPVAASAADEARSETAIAAAKPVVVLKHELVFTSPLIVCPGANLAVIVISISFTCCKRLKDSLPELNNGEMKRRLIGLAEFCSKLRATNEENPR